MTALDRSASGSRRARPGRSTSGPPGPRCSTSCTPGTSAARSSSGSRTRTRRAARSRTRRTSSTACTGWGLRWDEGPEVAGEAARGPARPVSPDGATAHLRGRGRAAPRRDQAYPCYCTPEELAADRPAQEAAKLPPQYVGRCAHLTPRSGRRARPRADAARHPLPGRGGGRRLRRHRPRTRRDRRLEPRRRLRHRPRRRQPAVPLHGRRRRRGDGDQRT